jgi:hypothetical protein
MGAEGRSALVNSPGYYPPDDPESLSVLSGRRIVEPVDLELLFAHASAEDLALAILAGLRTEDQAALHRLQVSFEEFGRIFWPEFPESRPATNIRLDDAWDAYETKCAAGRRRAVADYGGVDWTLSRITYEVGLAEYTNFNLYRGVRLHVLDGEGAPRVLSFVSSFAERNGRWKVLAYDD